MKIESVLKGHDLFQSLSVEDVEKISGVSSVKKYEPGEIIYRHNAAVSHVFLNLDGLVRLELPARAPELSAVISEVAAGELFGLAPLLGSDRYTATAIAVHPTSVMAIEAKVLRNVLHANPVLGLGVMARVARVYFDRYVGISAKLQGIMNQIR